MKRSYKQRELYIEKRQEEEVLRMDKSNVWRKVTKDVSMERIIPEIP